MKLIVTALQTNEDFAKFIAHPNIASNDKLDVLNKVFGNSVSETVLNTFAILIKGDRESIAEELLNHYVSIANAQTGSVSAVVTTATLLTDEDLAKVSKTFGQSIGKTVRAEQVVDPSLLGGLTIRVGDRLYDASLSGKLARLEKSLNTN